MKKLTTIAMAIALGCSLAACSKNQDNAGSASTSGSGSTSSSSSSADTSSGGTASSASTTPSTTNTPSSSTTAAAPAPSSTDAGAGSSAASPSTTAAADTSGSSGAAGAGAATGTNVAGAGSATAGNGQATFQQTCVVCHGAGVAGAPKVGDKADWGPRIAQGKEVLYQHALQGYTGKKGMMPPKGGNAALADADVKAAVDYMVAQAK